VKRIFKILKNRFERLESSTTTIANLLVIIGLILAYREFSIAKADHRKEIAIETIRETRTPEFLGALARMNTVASYLEKQAQFHTTLEQLYQEGDEIHNQNRLIDDLNLALALFANCWHLYEDELAERPVLMRGVKGNVRALASSLEVIDNKVPRSRNRVEFENLLAEVHRLEYLHEEQSRQPLPSIDQNIQK
jgi:hypothetical protein